MSETSPFLPYPRGFLRLALRAPLWLYRLGWGDILSLAPLLALTHIGRKSGLPRHTLLEYRRHGTKIYLLSGWGKRPDWVQNCLAHPTVTVQIGAQPTRARATLVTDSAEAMRAIYMFRRHSAFYDYVLSNMGQTDRIDFLTLSLIAHQFTVIKLEIDRTAPPENDGIAPDLKGAGLALFAGFAMLLLWGILSVFVQKPRR